MSLKDSRRDEPSDIRIILDSIADGVFTVDREFRITSFNRAATEISGVLGDEAIGRPCCEVFRAEICEADCALKRSIKTGRPIVNQPVYILRADGRRVPISVSTAILRDRKGRFIGGVETFRDLTLVEALRRQVDGYHDVGDIITRNHRIKEILAILPDVADSGSNVLIEGESGTGKELLARAIHVLGPHRNGPLVTVNCAALPDTLLESELFGYVAGAFTDAKRDRPGRFAQAEEGTLFLDEIGDISPALQVRLLRVLQDGTYQPLGSNATRTANVRIITATNRDLSLLVEAGDFRSDLYYRINVVRLFIPPLRERREDIPVLAQNFVDRMNLLRGRDVAGVSREALTIFMEYQWPGNVRELENAIEHAFILCRGGLIEPRHLPEALRPIRAGKEAAVMPSTLKEAEAMLIHDALLRNQWKRNATAADLGIHPATLWRKMKRFGLIDPDR